MGGGKAGKSLHMLAHGLVALFNIGRGNQRFYWLSVHPTMGNAAALTGAVFALEPVSPDTAPWCFIS
jgi:hypothetical protein